MRDGARPIEADPELLVSPCDGIIGASGFVEGTRLLQIKGFPYLLRDLLGDADHAGAHRNGCYVTIRLTSAMYHRFHTPYDCRVVSITYISGDTWNVNSIALKRIERLFCKNERALIRIRLSRTGHAVTLVPVAAILVASIRFSFLGAAFDLRRGDARTIALDVPLRKGDEMGWFRHGSTIVLFAPDGFRLSENVREGTEIRTGEPLMRIPRKENEGRTPNGLASDARPS